MKKLLTISGITFVAAWITGLMTATNGPKPSATGTALKAYYGAHQHSAMLQTLCVDAVAGLALIGITIGLSRTLAGPSRRRIQIAGFTAATISLIQAGIGEALAIQGASGGSPSLVRATVRQPQQRRHDQDRPARHACHPRLHRGPAGDDPPALADHHGNRLRTGARAQRSRLPAQQRRPVRRPLHHAAAAAALDAHRSASS